MASKILIATPQPEFGELIRLNIEEGGDYDATLVKTGREVMELSNSTRYDLVILDASLPDKPFVPMAQNLIDENPKMKIIVLPPNNDPKDASLEEIIYHGVLSRPFYPPDLVEMVNELLVPPPPEPVAAPSLPPAVVEPEAKPVPVEVVETLPDIKVDIPALLQEASPEKEENIGPINEEDFAREVEALFAQEASKSAPYDFFKEISASNLQQPEAQPVAQDAEPVLAEPEPIEISPEPTQGAELTSANEDETETFARQLAAQIRAETETKSDITNVKAEAEAILATEPVESYIPPAEPEINLPQEPAGQVEPVLEAEPQSPEEVNADFARQILSQVIQETSSGIELADSVELPPILVEESPAAAESPVETDVQPVIEPAVVEPVVIEPVVIQPVDQVIENSVLPETPQEALLMAPEMALPITAEPPITKEVHLEKVIEPLEDEEAVETYEELTQDDHILAHKHSTMAARYADLANEYNALAREHADLAQRHADLAAEKLRLAQEKAEMLTHKRELISEIFQTQHLLKEMISQTNAQAAIILKSGDLVAQVGDLNRDVFQEIASILVRYWDGDKKSDLIRFMRLQTDHSEQQLYAALIREDFILGLIYEPATSISLMRSQASRVTRKLSEEPLIDMLKLPVEDLEKISSEQPMQTASGNLVEPDEQEFDAFSDLPKASLVAEEGFNEWFPESTVEIGGQPSEDLSVSSQPPLIETHKDEIQPAQGSDADQVLQNVLAQLQSQAVVGFEMLAEPGADEIALPKIEADNPPMDSTARDVGPGGAEESLLEMGQPTAEETESRQPFNENLPDENPVDINAILREVNNQIDRQSVDSNLGLLAEAEKLDAQPEPGVESQIPEWITNGLPTPEGEVPFNPASEPESDSNREKSAPAETLHYDYEDDNWHIIRGVDPDHKSTQDLIAAPLSLDNAGNSSILSQVQPGETGMPENIDDARSEAIYQDVLAQIQQQEISHEETEAPLHSSAEAEQFLNDMLEVKLKDQARGDAELMDSTVPIQQPEFSPGETETPGQPLDEAQQFMKILDEKPENQNEGESIFQDVLAQIQHQEISTGETRPLPEPAEEVELTLDHLDENGEGEINEAAWSNAILQDVLAQIQQQESSPEEVETPLIDEVEQTPEPSQEKAGAENEIQPGALLQDASAPILEQEIAPDETEIPAQPAAETEQPFNPVDESPEDEIQGAEAPQDVKAKETGPAVQSLAGDQQFLNIAEEKPENQNMGEAVFQNVLAQIQQQESSPEEVETPLIDEVEQTPEPSQEKAGADHEIQPGMMLQDASAPILEQEIAPDKTEIPGQPAAETEQPFNLVDESPEDEIQGAEAPQDVSALLSGQQTAPEEVEPPVQSVVTAEQSLNVRDTKVQADARNNAILQEILAQIQTQEMTPEEAASPIQALAEAEPEQPSTIVEEVVKHEVPESAALPETSTPIPSPEMTPEEAASPNQALAEAEPEPPANIVDEEVKQEVPRSATLQQISTSIQPLEKMLEEVKSQIKALIEAQQSSRVIDEEVKDEVPEGAVLQQTSAPIQSREMTPEEVESPIEPLAGSEQPLITPEETTNDEVPGGTILEDTVVSPVEPQQTTPEPVETLDNLEKQSDDDKLAKITAEIMEGMNDETDAPHNQTVLQAEDQEGGISQPAAAVDIFQDVMSRLQNAGTQQNPSNPEPGNDQIAAMPGNVSDWVKVESPASEITTPSLAEENAPDSIAPEPPAFEPLSKTLELPENSTMPREYNNPADDLSLAQPSASAANNPFQATQPEIASPSPTQADSPEEIMGDLVLPWEEPPVEQGITSPISVKTNASVDVSRTQPVHVNPPAPARENPPGGSPGLDSSYRRTISHLLSHQSYTCLLVPRLSETPIYPELAHFLGEQMTQIASVFGWQLGSIHIQSDYMLWSVQVMPNVPVGNIIRIIRQRTSKRIFTQYPDLAKINDLGDFWAPGFLSANSTVPPPDAAIADFINQTRRRQELLRALEA